MNKLQLFVYPAVAALSLVAAMSAHAEGPLVDIGTTQATTQGKSRAEVKAELAQAMADGTYQRGGEGYDPLAHVPQAATSRTVMAVRAHAARSSDLSTAVLGEDSGSFYLSQHQGGRAASRAVAGGAAKSAQ